MESQLSQIKLWLDILKSVLTLVAGFVAAIWAYTKFIMERGLLPPAQFDAECDVIGIQNNFKIIQIFLKIKNMGTSAIIAKNIMLDIKYIQESDNTDITTVCSKKSYGRLEIDKTYKKDVLNHIDTVPGKKGICIMKYDTFIQPGIEQKYSFIIQLPKDSCFALVWGSFEYELRTAKIQLAILRLSRIMGLILYSLNHVNQPHTTERIFNLKYEEGTNKHVDDPIPAPA